MGSTERHKQDEARDSHQSIQLKWQKSQINRTSKATRKRKRVMGAILRLSADFSSETFQPEGSGMIYLKI